MSDAADVKRLPLPPRSPNLKSYAKRWIQSVKTEVLSQMILFGERSLRHVLSEYVAHHHAERPHQGKGNVILFPVEKVESSPNSPVECRERLGGPLQYYQRKAA
ncbi:MAG TPA: integrase core domain-containing protein [Candidatus Entotheonella sp.]